VARRAKGPARFVASREVLIALNAAVGAEEWGDLERAIAKTTHEKTGTKLWGGILPFWFETSPRKRTSPLARKTGDLVLGFDVEAPMSDTVLVWSVHTLVHSYPNVTAWLDDAQKGRARK
jgi:hypothetical protein